MTTRSAVDALSDAELDDVIRLLKDNYIKPDSLSEAEQKRATVQGLLDRLAPGAAIVESGSNNQNTASPFRAQILDNRIGYIRLGAISPENVGELDAALQKFTSSNLASLVLDLQGDSERRRF